MNDKTYILDTNIWISFILNRQFHILAQKIIDHQLDVVICVELINELRNVLKRGKFKKYITGNDINEAIALHIKLCRFIVVDNQVDVLTDKKDNFLIALYHQCPSSFLVSGDKQLLSESIALQVNTIKFDSFKEYLHNLE